MTEGPYKLPKNWRWVRLGEVCEIWDRYRVPVKKKERRPGNIPYCGANGIIDHVEGWTHEGEFVLLAEDGGFYGPGEKSAYLMSGRFWANNHVHILRGKKGVLENVFLMHYLNLFDLHPWLTGATRPKLNQTSMKQIPIPLPPLPEQRRIVARIEELIEQVRGAKRLRAEAKKDADLLMQSALAESFPRPGSPLPQGWRWVRLGEVCIKTQRRNPSQDPDSTFIYVDISAIDNNLGKITSPKILKGTEAPSRARKVIHANDVIFATTRPYLKNIAMVPSELDNQICSTGLCVIRANPKAVEPKYLYHLCRSDRIIEQLNTNRMRGASYPAVTDDDVFETYIPLPPLPKQHCIIAYLDQIQAQVTALKQAQQETETELRLLEQAILEKAFRGEL